MMPTPDEFGVKKAVVPPVQHKGPTISGVEWPSISRTMQHVRGNLGGI